MADDTHKRLEQLRHSITVLEAQRATLGEAVVESALAGLRLQIESLETQSAPFPAPAEERRLITILFTDIVGSTTIAERLDPEEWRKTVAAVHDAVGTIIQEHQGSVVQYLGDGLLALFGARTASEHDPEHAIRAALEAQNAVAALPAPQPLRIRIGIHAGPVIVGEFGSDAKREFTATGDAMNLAARLQSAAPPNGILISQDTYNHVRGVFDVTPQPVLTVKGKQDPIQTYLVRRAKARPFRRVARGVAGIQTRTVGRDEELNALRSAYADAFTGRGVVWAQLVGEAGVGKSRLLEDVNDWIELRPDIVRIFRARAYPEDARQPFSLIRRMWFDRYQIAEDAPLQQAERKWVERFQELGRTEEVEPAHALGLLVGLSFKDSPHVAGIRGDPSQVRGRAFVVSREILKRVREETPIVLLLEDLEWADGASWDYLTQVMLEAQPEEGRQGIFVLAAARPEWNPPGQLSASPNYRRMDLEPLSDQATRELVTELLQRVEGVPDDIVQLIVDRSEGVPYFAEEMVNWFVDRGIVDRSREPWQFVPARLRETPLPATLQHLLLTRLSSLHEHERSVLQRGAIFGRNFWTGGIAALGVRDPEQLLHPLQPRGFVEAQPESSFEGETEWSFHHGLLRDVTYESVLKRERTALHRAAAAWLEEQARRAGRLDEFAGLLGEHAERAGEMTAAADWYLHAGDRAKAQGATAGARRFYDHALELLPPVDRERRWRALLGREEVLGVLGEPDAWRADLAALLELAKDLGDDARIAEAYVRQASYGNQTADYRSALRAAGDAATAARRAGDAVMEIRALGLKSRAETRLGEMDAAAQSAGDALDRAEALGDERTLALTLRLTAMHYLESWQIARALRAYRRHLEIEHRFGNRIWEASGRLNEGYALILLGDYKSGRAALERGLEIAEAVGARRQRAYALQNLGLAYFRIGDGRTARQILERSLVDMVAVDDPFGRAASVGYIGYVLEASGDMAGAARRFEEAKGVFTDLGALPSMIAPWAGLARCALAQGRLDDARRDAEEIAGYLSTHGTKGLESPTWAYQTCADIFDALGELEQARTAVEAGYRELMERVEKIDEPEWKKSFLENVPEHRAIIELWERLTLNRG